MPLLGLRSRVTPLEIAGPLRERSFSGAGDRRFDLTEIQFPLRPSTGASP
jgi:hypothetical protein